MVERVKRRRLRTDRLEKLLAAARAGGGLVTADHLREHGVDPRLGAWASWRSTGTAIADQLLDAGFIVEKTDEGLRFTPAATAELTP